MSCFKFVDYENQRYKDIDVCSQMQKQNKNQSSKSKFRNKTSKSKSDLFPKTKNKSKKNDLQKKEVSKVQKKFEKDFFIILQSSYL
jgi:hypothetical protein